MNVHILNKVWEQKWGDWGTNKQPYRYTKVSIKLCIGTGADMGSQVHINACTDDCTHSKQGVGTKLGDWDTNTLAYRDTQVSIKLCIQGGADMGSQDDLNSCTDACTHSKQVVGTEMRWPGHIHTDIQGYPGFHQTMHRECYTHQQAGRYKFIYWCMYTF